MTKNEEDFIINLNRSRDVTSKFVIAEKIIRTSAKGRDYLDITLADKTGQIAGRIFDDVENAHNTINQGSICRIKGRLNEFPSGSGKYNMVINDVVELTVDEYDISDYVMTTDSDQDELIDEINSTIKSIQNSELKNLLRSFFCDKEFTDKFYKSPAAIVHHHNYLGGLLDHTVGVLKLCKTSCQVFPELDKDLLYTGVLLHDIGKMKSYTYGKGPIGMSMEGELLDHIYISCEMVKEKIQELKLSDDLSYQILHMILSHHGNVSLGWGSTVDPKTPEAIALHHADNMDAKVKEKLQR